MVNYFGQLWLTLIAQSQMSFCVKISCQKVKDKTLQVMSIVHGYLTQAFFTKLPKIAELLALFIVFQYWLLRQQKKNSWPSFTGCQQMRCNKEIVTTDSNNSCARSGYNIMPVPSWERYPIPTFQHYLHYHLNSQHIKPLLQHGWISLSIYLKGTYNISYVGLTSKA